MGDLRSYLAQLAIEDLIAEGVKVVTRYTAQMTPSAATTGTWIDRIQEDQVLESWVDWDRLGLFRQLVSFLQAKQGGEEV